MKTGDVVLDAQGRSYQVGPLLGRGLWGKSYLVRHGDSRAEFVLKCPLSRDDFRGDVPLTDTLLGACQNACAEQAMMLGEGAHVFLPPLQSRQAEDGSPLLILPRFTTTLDRRIAQGCTLNEVLTVLISVCGHLTAMQKDVGLHGNLRPSNILLNDRGDVLLADMATPAAIDALGQLHAISPEPNHYLPPEVLRGEELAETADTYAVAMTLYRAVMTLTDGDDNQVVLPVNGLDKGDKVVLKDRAVERLQAEDSNPRFHARFAEKLSSVLGRALSQETAPSPPYRFQKIEEFGPRLEELRSLIRPRIDMVGKVMLDRPPGSSTFESDEEVSFGISVGVSIGVDNHDEIACGIAAFDDESGERIRDVECAYTVDRHPSGRFRFSFRVMELGPGRYRTRVAFAIRDSGHPPETAEAIYEVRAAAGYVPPSSPKPGASALPFMDPDEEVPATQPSADLPRPTNPPVPAPVAAPIPKRKALGSAIDDAIGDPDFGNEPEETLNFMLDADGKPQPIHPPKPVVPARPERPADPMNEEIERTEPAVQVQSQLPEPDPLTDIVGARSWTDVPLPGDEGRDLSTPELDDVDLPVADGPIGRFVELLRGDTYLQFMVAAGGVIVILMLALLVLRG